MEVLMPTRLERLQADKDRLEREKVARIDEARKRGADTRKRRTRTKAFIAYLRLARTDGRQISVALVSKKSGVSQAAFYENFKSDRTTSPDADSAQHGIAALLVAICDRIARVSIRELDRQLIVGNKPIEQSRRVAITVNSLVRTLLRYPNLFNVEGKIPRDVIYALSAALREAITRDEDMTAEEVDDAAVIALYHTTALIGILRSGLGSHFEPDEYMGRLIRRTVAQIVPVLASTSGRELPSQLARMDDIEPPALLRVTEFSSYQTVLTMQLELLGI